MEPSLLQNERLVLKIEHILFECEAFLSRNGASPGDAAEATTLPLLHIDEEESEQGPASTAYKRLVEDESPPPPPPPPPSSSSSSSSETSRISIHSEQRKDLLLKKKKKNLLQHVTIDARETSEPYLGVWEHCKMCTCHGDSEISSGFRSPLSPPSSLLHHSQASRRRRGSCPQARRAATHGR
jgi:hypothetical protein